MIKDIVKDTEVLQRLSAVVRNNDKEAKQVVQDLLDTAKHHIDNCLGLAAVQIGVHKNIIVIRNGKGFMPMVNPIILWKSNETATMEEGCLSFEGTRSVCRPVSIEVGYQESIGGRYHKVKLVDKVDDKMPFARVIQHEIDHTKGALI